MKLDKLDMPDPSTNQIIKFKPYEIHLSIFLNPYRKFMLIFF